MNENYYAVIMAGGGGTRLWPLSRTATPKQMLPLVGERSLFQISVDRLEGIFPPERIFVVTVAEQAAKLQAQCPAIPTENFLLEPMPRGTASVVGLAAVALAARHPQAVMAVLTADHIFEHEDHFRALLRAAFEAAQDDHLVTLGIEPTFPATGYGYIQQGAPVAQYHSLQAYVVRRFVEKPAEPRARTMLASGDYAWNSGMFVWQVGQILGEFEQQMPALASTLNEISRAWHHPERESVIQRLWPLIQPETIDYGIMEKAQDVVVIPAKGLGWNDVGSWEALYEVLPADEQGNISVGGQHVSLDSTGALVFNPAGERLIVTIGVDDLVVVDAGDVVMVCKKDQAQKVRQIVANLKETGRQYL